MINTGYGGEFRISNDTGATWEYPNNNIRNFYRILVGKHGNLLGLRLIGKDQYGWAYTKNYGKYWIDFNPQFFDQHGNSQSEIYCWHTGNFIDDGKTLRLMAYDSNSDTLAWKVYESNNFGKTWHYILTCERFNQYFLIPRFFSQDTLFDYHMSKRQVSPGNYQTMLLFTYSFDDGRIAKTDTFPTIWNKNKNTSSFVSKHYFINGHTGLLVGSEGNIIKTTNTGRSWENIPSGVVEDLWDITFVNRQTVSSQYFRTPDLSEFKMS